MVRKLIELSLDNPLLVMLLGCLLIVSGVYAFVNVNVEAYPDPAPAIIEVVAQRPGWSAEEMERQVTIPIEVALAGMPGLTSTRSKSLFGLSHLRNQFDYGIDYERAKQEVINRLGQATLPESVRPMISPASPIGEIYRYTIRSPKDENGSDIYTLGDLKALQDYTLQREFLRIPRIGGCIAFGGKVKRYEVQPDPVRMRQYGIALDQLQKALAGSNLNVGGDYLVQGEAVMVVRGVGLLGGGQDPMQHALTMPGPRQAAAYLRAEEARRIRQIRQIVLTSVNNQPISVDHVVDGGPLRPDDEVGQRGVVISHQTRLGQIGLSRPKHDEHDNEVHGADGKPVWIDEDDKVQAIIILRKGQESLPALRDVQAKIKELNETPGRLLPGVKLEPYYNRTRLIHLTTETVNENLLVGMGLVTVILLMFLSNVRTALIVAINVPLALLFAFATLFLRGKSANLLSIGAVDFGIIVDSTVIMVENIYRHLSSGENVNLSQRERMIRASGEVQRSLFFSTLIMVVALLPLFTMKGPEGQIFGPMADTYAYALVGALLLAITVSPVLCLLLMKNLNPARDNLLVRGLKRLYLWQLDTLLGYRWAAVGGFILLVVLTVGVLPVLGREFMPELEEGNMYIRGTFRLNSSLDSVTEKVRTFREIVRHYPEVEAVVSQTGRPDDGTDMGGFYNVESFVPLRPEEAWPVLPDLGRRWTKKELIQEMLDELDRKLPGADWDFSQMIRDNVLEAISGVKGENSIKIFGPDLSELDRLAQGAIKVMAGVPGVDNPGILRIKGQSNLELTPDYGRCKLWGVRSEDVLSLVQTAIGGKACTQVNEGEKLFDLTLRFPLRLRGDLEAIKKLPVEILNNVVTPYTSSLPQTALSGATMSGFSLLGTSAAFPTLLGTVVHPNVANVTAVPQRRLGDLIMPVNERGLPDPKGSYIRPGASTISREQGQRYVAVKFAVKGRDLAGTVADAQNVVNPLIKPPYRVEWGGEFQEMEEAEERLLKVVMVSLAIIFFLLYLALRSFLDALVVYANVLAMSLGGLWALLLTGTNFNISAAVGFISILGVAVMNGLLLVSSFNQARAHGVELKQSLLDGINKLIRPVTMTALAAILGLLPAALSTRIGSQSQRPLAIVVVGGMIATLLLTNLVPILYSFYGHREPSREAAGLGH